MKKFFGILVGVAIIAAIIYFVLFSGGFGLGNGAGTGDGTGEDIAETASADVADTEAEESPATDTEEPLVDGENDATDKNAGTIVEITVTKSEYFVENKRVSLDEVADIIESIEGKLAVEVTDDSASLRAYNALIDLLDDLFVPYTELNVN